MFEGVRLGIDALAAGVRSGAAEWAEQIKVAAQTNAVLASTRGIANVTARQVSRLASAISRLSGIDDEAIQSASNLILTFKNVRNELGRGNRIFDRATQAAVDLSVAGFGSLDSTAKQLGKALNDPVRGMTALGRAGVTFTQQQRDTIKALVEANRTLDAQRLILREVESQVGGSARAFGQTLPGQLSRMRESLKNTFGDLVSLVVPSLTGALDAVNRFIDRLGAARTVRARLDVVWEGVRGAAEGATEALGRAVSAIDWAAVWSQARGIADGLQQRLEEVDWGVIGREIGDAFADAVRVAIPAAKELAERVSDAVGAIDFEELGKKLGPGLAAAVVTAFVTLLDPAFWARNWDLALAVAATMARGRLLAFAGKLAAPFARLGSSIVLAISGAVERFAPRIASVLLSALIALPRVAARALSPLVRVVSALFSRLGRIARLVITVLGLQAAINAVVGFARRVGAVFGNLGRSIASALDRAWEALKRGAIRAALEIIEPFTHIPRRLGGGVFQDLKASWQDTLAVMEADAKSSTDAIQRSINNLQGRKVTVTVETRHVTLPGSSGDRLPAGGDAAGRAAAAGAKKAAGEAAKTQAQVTKAETDAAARIAAVRARAAAQARRAANAAAKALEKSREAFAALMDSLSLRADKAEATKGLRDDLAVARDVQAAIAAQIKVEGETTELLRQQFEQEQRIADLQRQIADNRRQARQGRQFEQLGLTATGEQRAPSAQALSKRLTTLREQVKGTILDTDKTRAQLRNIAKVLSGAFGKVGRDVRLAIQRMLQGIVEALKQDAGGAGGEITRGGIRSTQRLIKGLKLTSEQADAIRRRNLGVERRNRATAFGFAVAGGAGVVVAGGGGVNINGPITVVANDPDAFMRELQKRASRSAPSRRGRHGGRNLGLG